MGKREALELLPGTLDLLILKALVRGKMHGYGIAYYIKQISNDVLQVEEGSLYPAIQCLAIKGWVKAEWGQSENNRRARYYELTKTGRKALGDEVDKWHRFAETMALVLES